MGILEEVTQLKKGRVPDEDIINRLQEKGYTPKAINNALNQSEIKDAVSRETPRKTRGNEMEGMQESIMGRGETDIDYPPPQSQERPNPGVKEQQNSGQQENYYGNSQEYAEPYPGYYQEQQVTGYDNSEYYPQEQYGYATPQVDSGSIVEIAEQVFSKSNKKIEEKIETLSEFKSIAQAQIEQLNERMKRIESTLDKMQAAILEKIGSYGNNLESIKKEMEMIEDSFSKITHKKSSKK